MTFFNVLKRLHVRNTYGNKCMKYLLEICLNVAVTYTLLFLFQLAAIFGIVSGLNFYYFYFSWLIYLVLLVD